MAYITETVAVNQFFDKLIANMKSNGWTETVTPTNITPKMTSNTAPTPYVVSASTFTAGNDPWKAFNHTIVDSNDAWVSSASPTGWIKFDFGTSATQTVGSYAITARVENVAVQTSAPKDFIFEGFDGTNWVQLDSRTGQTNWAPGERRIFTCTTAVAAYHAYRLTINANNSGTVCAVAELGLLEPLSIATVNGNVESQMQSSGTSGSDTIMLVINKGSSKNAQGNHMTFSMVDPQPTGTFANYNPYYNNYMQTYYFGASTSTTLNNTSCLLTYYMDVTKDRVFFATVLDPAATTPANNAAYIGMMKRYATDDTTAVTIAVGMQMQGTSANGIAKALKNKSNMYNANYSTRTIDNNYSPSVWGDVILVSPVFMEGDYEGMRGELDGVYACRTENVVNEDEIAVGTSTYKVIMVTAYGYTAFPYASVLFKLPAA